MAARVTTVEIQPTHQLEAMIRRVVQQAVQAATPEPGFRRVKLITPDGERYLFMDQANQEHWRPIDDGERQVTLQGWRALYERKD